MATWNTSSSGKRRPYTGPIYTFRHPQLGSLTGRLINSPHFKESPVVQFRSIPYAKVIKRFAPCVPLETTPQDGHFTQFGAACPQNGVTNGAMKAEWFDAYGGALEDDLGLEFDEFTCLTVSISVPEKCLSIVADEKDVDKLPVMVYVHGGGAQEGIGHVDGHHSNAPLAAYSSELFLPTITVNLGYRLNWFGSLVCQDVLDEYSANTSVSPHGPFNLTIQDQRAAFHWIHKFIGGFGGDTNNITAFGESAGSLLLIYHICGSPERLFNRVILQSGVLFGFATFEQKDAEYKGLLKHFGIDGTSGSERLEKLRQIPAEELAKYPGQHTLPFVDDLPGVAIEKPLFPRGRPTFHNQLSLVSSCPWLDDIMIGDDFWEGYIFRDMIRGATAERCFESVRSIFSETQATKLLEVYDLPSDPQRAAQIDKNLFWGNLTYLVGDLMLSQPIHQLANHLALASATSSKKRKIYRYSFGLTNPIPGSEHSFVTGHHFVEILFLFLTLLDRYPRHRDGWADKQAKETGKRWISFANGKAPWDEYIINKPQEASNARLAVCDDLRGWHVRTVAEDEQESKSDPWGRRRYDGWAAIQETYASLQSADEGETEAWAQKVHVARLTLLGSLVGNLSGPGFEDKIQDGATKRKLEKELESVEEKVADVL